jgi:hypothetical protein
MGLFVIFLMFLAWVFISKKRKRNATIKSDVDFDASSLFKSSSLFDVDDDPSQPPPNSPYSTRKEKGTNRSKSKSRTRTDERSPLVTTSNEPVYSGL